MQTLIGGDGKDAPGAVVVKDSDTKNFKKDVLDESAKVPVIVDFWAPWCGPCKQLGPLLERLVKAARGAVKMVKINVDQNQQLAGQLRIQSIPAVYAFKGGRPVDAFVGALPESQVKAFIDRLIKSGGAAPEESAAAQILEMAKEAMKNNDAAAAASLYARLLDEEPDNVPARIGLARAAAMLGEIEQAQEMIKDLPPEARKGADYDSVKAAIELAEKAKSMGDLGVFEDKIAADPNDHEARYNLALALYAGGHAEAAIQHLLNIVKRNRAWNEEAARKELLRIFDALGGSHELTLKGRRGLSTILFS